MSMQCYVMVCAHKLHIVYYMTLLPEVLYLLSETFRRMMILL